MSFAEYVQAGWVLCRIQPGTKVPKGDGWNIRENGIRDPAIAQHLMSAGLCHAWSQTCTLDIDNWDVAEEFLAKLGINLRALFDADDAVQISSGKAGRGKLLFRLAVPLPSISLAPYKAPNKKDPTKLTTLHGLELRCATAGGLSVQDVLPPSIHPETCRPYAWICGPLGHWSTPPELPAALHALWTAQREPPTAEPRQSVSARGIPLNELRALIHTTDPNLCAYDDWLAMGARIHHETGGSPDGYTIWCEWSARCSKHDLTHMPVKWASFGKTDGPVLTIGSLMAERTAGLEEFPVTGETREERGVDTQLSTAVDELLQRIVFVLGQERYYHRPLPKEHPHYIEILDSVGKQGLKAAAFDTLYYPHTPLGMKEKKGGGTETFKIDPKKAVRESRHVPRVNGLGFHPGEGRIFVEADGNRYLNDYTPRIVEPLRPMPKELDAWAFLCSRIPHNLYRSWLLKFYAHALAKPGVKIQSAPLLVSDTHGTGKTTWMQTIPQLLYGVEWVREVSSELLSKTFNAFLASAWWISIEELKTDGPRMDAIAIANKLKPWITSIKIPVEFKGLDAYDMFNRVQITASSNSRQALQLDNTDRRWGVGHAIEVAMTDAEKAGLFGDFLNTPRAPGVVRWLVQQESLTGFSPTATPPATEEKTSMVMGSYGTWETSIAELMCDRKPPFDRDIVRLDEVQEAVRSKRIEITRKRLGMLLRKAPFNANVKSDGATVLYCWNNVEQWRQFKWGSTEWTAHVETGVRPRAAWADGVPLAIQQIAGQDWDSDESVHDLVGDLNG